MIGRKEIAKMLNVSGWVLRNKIEARPDFPKPALRLSRQTVRWEPQDVLRWLARQKSAQS